MQTMLVMRQMMAVLDGLMREVTRRVQLTPEDALVLGWMVERPGISGSDIAYRIGRSRQSVQRAVERLERRALAERYTSSVNDRTVGWALTEEGYALWAEVERGFRLQEEALRSRGVVVRPFLEGLKTLMTEMMSAGPAMARLGLVDPPPREDVPGWDL